MKLLDTNIILRWLLEDDKHKADRIAHLLRQATTNKEQFFISDISVAEMVWVLESYYKLARQSIAEITRKLLSTQGLFFEHADRLFDSIAVYENHNVDYIDAYLFVLSKEKKLDGIVSYDKDFDKLSSINRFEP